MASAVMFSPATMANGMPNFERARRKFRQNWLEPHLPFFGFFSRIESGVYSTDQKRPDFFPVR